MHAGDANSNSGAENPFPLDIAGYEVDVLVQGYPGKSMHNGGLGWSTVVLLKGHGRIIVLDAGGFGLRRVVIEKLHQRGIALEDVTDLILSHAHWDHIVNYPLFSRARIWIGRVEMEWALGVEWGKTAVPELYVKELAAHENLNLIEDGQEVLPNITAQLAPGHTPGHLLFILAGETRDLILLQDAVKTRAELISRDTDMTYDPAVSAATVEKVWALWRRRPGTILIPGHDLPLILAGDEVKLMGTRQAGVTATFGASLEDITRFPLSGPA